MNWLPILRELTQLPPLIYGMVTAEIAPLKEAKISFGDHSRQYMLLYQPMEGTVEQDVVIYFIHGGGWRVGRPERRRPLAEMYTRLGYTVVMPTYRLIPRYNSFDLEQDARLGLKAFMQLPEAQGKRIVLMGESAGGNLAALLLYKRDFLHDIGISHDHFAGFISMAGVLDMEGMPDNFYMRKYNGKRSSDLFHQSNPVNFLREDENIPVLIVHGTKDGLVPIHSAKKFASKLQLIRPDLVDMHIVENGSHMSVAGGWLLHENDIRKKVTSWIQGL